MVLTTIEVRVRGSSSFGFSITLNFISSEIDQMPCTTYLINRTLSFLLSGACVLLCTLFDISIIAMEEPQDRLCNHQSVMLHIARRLRNLRRVCRLDPAAVYTVLHLLLHHL